MTPMQDYGLRPVESKDLEQMLKWRNSDRVRLNMYNSELITPEEHQAWWLRTENNPEVCYMLFQHLDRPVGLVCFTDIDISNSKCEWGFYLGETDVPRGTGTVMGFLALEHAFETRGMRKVYGAVLGFNASSRKFFLRLGFHQDGTLRQHVRNDGDFVDVMLFSLLADEWNSRKNSDEFMALLDRVMETAVDECR